MARVVVGVDGSENSVRALHEAAEQARHRGARLTVVSAWHFPALAMLPGPEDVPTPAGLEGAAQRAIDESIDKLGPGALDGLEVERKVVEGHPADVLLREAEGADLLVVGSQGLGGFRGMLLGSVSSHCAHHATIPVMVVRAPK